MCGDAEHGADLVSVAVSPVSSREYEFAAEATLSLRGPAGELRLRRRYEALPRHNDVVAPGVIDSNDELVDRPDAIHVHTRFYAVESARTQYFLDAHETWIPDNLSALSDERAFLDACREHHLVDLDGTYRRVMARRHSSNDGSGAPG